MEGNPVITPDTILPELAKRKSSVKLGVTKNKLESIIHKEEEKIYTKRAEEKDKQEEEEE